MKEKMTENNLKEDFLIDKIADKVSKSKWARALFAGTTLFAVTQTACTTSPPAEVAPAATEEKVFKAEFSGIITREKVAEVSGETKVILDQELDSIEAKYSSIPGYVKGTEMSYWISTSDDKVMAYHLVGVLNDNDEVGVQILEFSNLKTNKSQEINSPLVRLDPPDGGSYFGWVDEKGESHLIASYYSDGETHLIDPDENVYVENKSSFEELVEGVVSIGVMNVQAALDETVVPSATLPPATPEPKATKKEPTVKPTEIPLIAGNIFFDPQSEADLAKVVESPSPIDNPKEFAVWQDEYLRQIYEKLETYDGPYMVLENNTIAYDIGMYIFGGNEWKVMASYQFPWTDEAGIQQSIINKTYVFEDALGNKIPLTVTYSLLSSGGVWDVEKGYKTPLNKSVMVVRYEWEAAKEFMNDPFVDTFLPNRDKNDNFVIWRDVLGGIGASREDIEITSRVPILFGMFGDGE